MTKFLCDTMLTRLGHWLRAAGYDTEIAETPHDDTALLRLARETGRTLITCDKRMIKEREPGQLGTRVVLLNASALDAAVPELASQITIDWLKAPFSRCMMDNALLEDAAAEEAEKVPPQSRGIKGAVRRCPECGRLYWPGGHVQRMRAQLEAWQATRNKA